jgi:hypothetical protein
MSAERDDAKVRLRKRENFIGDLFGFGCGDDHIKLRIGDIGDCEFRIAG